MEIRWVPIGSKFRYCLSDGYGGSPVDERGPRRSTETWPWSKYYSEVEAMMIFEVIHREHGEKYVSAVSRGIYWLEAKCPRALCAVIYGMRLT